MSSNVDPLIGQTLGTSTIEQLIGRGGMGAVYLAQQQIPHRKVAVKVLLPNAIMSQELYQEFLTRFQREANFIAQLDHVNIMPIYEYGQQNKIVYFVMPHMPNGSLRSVLAQKGRLSPQEALTYIEDIAFALDYAHGQGIVHRDLKPANVLLRSSGRPVLADFGIAKAIEESNNTVGQTLTGTGVVLGTPEYMAPEMFTGGEIDQSVDIYALGIMLFQMFSGQVPFKGDTTFAIANRHVNEPPPSLSLWNPTLSASIDGVIRQALAKRREDRFRSAGQLAQALRATLAPNAPVVATPRPLDMPPTAIQEANTYIKEREAPPPFVQNAQSAIYPIQAHNTPLPASQPAILPAQPITPPPTGMSSAGASSVGRAPKRQQALFIALGLLLILALVGGGIFVGTQLRKSPDTSTGQSIHTTPPAATIGSTPPMATATPTSTPIPTLTPTPTSPPPTNTPIPYVQLKSFYSGTATGYLNANITFTLKSEDQQGNVTMETTFQHADDPQKFAKFFCQGSVTTDRHLNLRCVQEDNQSYLLNVQGYIYQDGHIEGTETATNTNDSSYYHMYSYTMS